MSQIRKDNTACLPRLKREIVELYNEPLKGIKVKLHENDITSMCLILTLHQGPYKNLRLHYNVKIPQGYPQIAPIVTIQTPVRHPNVFGTFICADILQAHHHRSSDYYNGGYTPGYLLKYIFLQILSFFSDNNVEQEFGFVEQINSDHEDFRTTSEKVVKKFECKICGYNDLKASKPLMPILTDKELQKEMKEMDSGCSSILSSVKVNPKNITVKDSSYVSTTTVNDLDDDAWLHIIEFLPDRDIVVLSNVYARIRTLVQFYNILTRRQLVCFFLRKTFRECVLGVGVNAIGRIDKRKITISEFDLFSYEAFKDHGLREGIWGGNFTNFLPLVLNKTHFNRALPIIKSSLMALRGEIGKPWNSSAILKTIPSLMNTTVVALMKACDESGQPSRSKVLKASEKALQGYCLLLHLLLKLSKQFPEIITEAENKVKAFNRDRRNRQKSSTPDLGEFMIYFFLAKNVSWSEFVPCFLKELLSRNVVWYLCKVPGLAFLEPEDYVSKYRVEETFTQSGTSLRLVMFQIAFMNMVKGKEDDMDRRYGYPSNEMSNSLLSLIKEIYAAKTWNVFFKVIGFPLPEKNWESEICDMLTNAVRDSEASKYHQNPYTNNELFYLRRTNEANIPTPNSWLNDENNKVSEIEKYGVVKFLTFQPGERNIRENENKRHSFSFTSRGNDNNNNNNNINIINDNYGIGGIGGRGGRGGGRGGRGRGRGWRGRGGNVNMNQRHT
ncbi:uncharacterized protein OCT59_020465 [Rhizophagus irregularis]|uniref:UBC core domain-containing protein n=2 Tax=Rhizophagus irregularis TaxID=588596 RepID=A0A2H5S791_RHIID|nr:hypothetical protein GLOIN_2v1459513 [Rhizophagus irregularis DAOM 181602=DAOM 197198]EXX60046.1 putative E2 ubiquitin-protein ligase UBC11 [Rhizophagus irregularis DAOM 197198w]POG68569.1 hypothetical protein GLOIN_2v1459513 [Rhizophagus irregularis DAOM 181602=DAOM 197198]UZO01959.1 hypothetical protein OCT59_020465 [Rhizophagus irregularis]GBC26210.1 ubiquitin-conjugating enzyme family protein [Rhizophagus irregularis DAOM 181602=DAOM 197198]|eukprot:XP_025175435.1 hypothetical protein GLOIN_2v1459513 [Rhizophagus irregularis DAOM 181602=DAOM 197198]